MMPATLSNSLETMCIWMHKNIGLCSIISNCIFRIRVTLCLSLKIAFMEGSSLEILSTGGF